MENEIVNNDQLVKEYDYQSMIFKKTKENVIHEYYNQLKLYKETKMKNDKILRTIISLQHLYEYEMKIDKFHHDFVNVFKNIQDVSHTGVKNNEINFLDKNINQFTKEQKLRMQISKNSAFIKHLEKQLSIVISKVDEHEENLITKYTNHLISKK